MKCIPLCEKGLIYADISIAIARNIHALIFNVYLCMCTAHAWVSHAEKYGKNASQCFSQMMLSSGKFLIRMMFALRACCAICQRVEYKIRTHKVDKMQSPCSVCVCKCVLWCCKIKRFNRFVSESTVLSVIVITSWLDEIIFHSFSVCVCVSMSVSFIRSALTWFASLMLSFCPFNDVIPLWICCGCAGCKMC